MIMNYHTINIMFNSKSPYFGLRGGGLTFWITLACGADMTLYGYDQVSHYSIVPEVHD